MVFTETGGGSQMPKYKRERKSERERARRQAGHSTSSPMFGLIGKPYTSHTATKINVWICK